ncbi:hypothetical protein [Desulfofustis limnaeus]|uniref:Uncharacterized protein n=1 Tax=Desulfofustis limnaeus TaxID=2740163 RepID=A0ABN6M8L1_9BACT|nr:hypothetical protein [Desulfofustis limnaeus]BDD89186.1 hypothetical protein DPPLL_35510 [Desulfofustis limnaeus]
MSKVIRIPIELYDRLSVHAEGFDTPADVIQRILDYYEGEVVETSGLTPEMTQERPRTLEIRYYPDNDEQEFKRALLEKRRAYLHLYKTNGTVEMHEWNAEKFTESSSVSGNLRSGYLRDWKKKGIYKAEISTDESDLIPL